MPVFSSFARLHTLIFMAETTENPLELILQLCPPRRRIPWYPSAYAKAAGIDRDSLDPHLDRLRLAGLIRLTDWMPGTGQGYVLTPAGKELVANPRAMGLLRAGNLRFEVKPPTVEPLLEDAVAKRFAHVLRRGSGGIREAGARPHDLLADCRQSAGFRLWLSVSTKGWPVGTGLRRPAGSVCRGIASTLAWPMFIRLRALSALGLVQGQWWRLLSSCFVHLGLVHLVGNMLVLYFIGPLTERMWGSERFLVIYLLAGFGGACATAYFGGSNTVGAGASEPSGG